MIIPGIGTAQLGLPYGAYAHENLMPAEEAAQILKHVIDYRIPFIDTARAYGESEKRIGAFLATLPNSSSLSICTKFPRVENTVWRDEKAFTAAMNESLAQSESLLGKDRITLMLLHQCEIPFLSTPHINEYFKSIAMSRPNLSLGVSIYSKEEAAIALTLPWVSYLQCPVNMIDQRFIEPKFVANCREHKVKLIARSIFLQGILTNDTPIPSVAKKVLLSELRERLREAIKDRTLEEASISFIFTNHAESLDVGIFGIHSVEELDNNMEMLASASSLDSNTIDQIAEAVKFSDKHQLYDPRTWNT